MYICFSNCPKLRNANREKEIWKTEIGKMVTDLGNSECGTGDWKMANEETEIQGTYREWESGDLGNSECGTGDWETATGEMVMWETATGELVTGTQ